MGEERRRLSQIFDPLARFTDLAGAGHSTSMPNSPRLLPRRARDGSSAPPRPVAPAPRLDPMEYGLEDRSAVNWQERCLELQLELHRSRNQATRVRDMLRDKLSELEQRVLEAEGRAEEAEDKVRAMEQRLCEWPAGTDGAPRALSRLEGQIEEQMPETVADWKQISKAFEERWQFPNCLGAIDGKHVRIMPPSDSGSFFHNYKGYSSIVLMACANANYEFIWCEVGINGRISDGGSIKQTQFYKDLISNNLNIPSIERSQTSTVLLPYVFVGDEAFTLRTDFMKPFGKNSLTAERKVYNYRLSRARRVIENIFGIMSNRFRIFHTPINLRLDRIDLVVMTCCVLHNFLRKSSSPYATSDLFEMDDITDEDVIPSPAFNSLERMNGNATQDAKSVREAYVAYFNGEGSVSWQNDRIG